MSNKLDSRQSHEAYANKSASYFGNARTDIAPLIPQDVGRPLRVLEVGCGDGATMRWLRSVCVIEEAVGVELTPSNAEAARAVFDRMIVGSVEDPEVVAILPHVDLIIALDVLEHLADPAAVVRSLARRLAPGGAFIVSLPNIGHYTVAVPLLLKGRWTYRDEGILDRTHLRFFDCDSARLLLADNGMAVDRFEQTEQIFLNDIRLFRQSKRLRWYAARVAPLIIPRHLLVYHFLVRGRRIGDSV